jgi:prepilin-type processing-associated H-X9-DG protein
MNNLRNIGIAHMQYINENDGSLIPGAQLLGTVLWFNALDAYMGGQANDSLLSTKRPAWRNCPAKVFPSSSMNQKTVGYGWNLVYFGLYPYSTTGSAKIGEVPKLSETIIIADSYDDVTLPDWVHSQLNANTPGTYSLRHLRRGNYLMLDCHVEALDMAAASTNSYYLFKKLKP